MATDARSDAADLVAELEKTLERAFELSPDLVSGDDSTVVDARWFHRDASRHFHQTVARLSGSKALAELSDHLAKRTRWYFSPRVLDRREDAWREHAELTAAIAKGHEDEAMNVMQQHMEGTRTSDLRAFRSR